MCRLNCVLCVFYLTALYCEKKSLEIPLNMNFIQLNFSPCC